MRLSIRPSSMRLVKPPLKNWGIEVDRTLEPEERASIFEEFKVLNPFLQAEGKSYSFIELWTTNESLILDVIIKSSISIDI